MRGQGNALNQALRCSVGALALTAAAIRPDVGHAQARPGTPAPNELSEVIVTGTSIRGIAPVGSTVKAIDQEVIKSTGLSNTGDIVRSLPQFLGLGAQEGQGSSNQNANQNLTQGSGINLRGIGATNTLVLINGRRVAPSGTNAFFTDVSTIPAASIARLEVVADGASAIYGSDSVAGVVNFILRRNFDGLETGLKYGGAKGFDQKQASLIAGRTWQGGDVAFTYERFEQSPLRADARAFLSSDLRRIGGADRRSNFANPGTIVVGTQTYAIPAGQNGVGLRATSLVAGTANLLDSGETRDYLAQQKRDNFVLTLHQQITPGLKAYYEGFYSTRDYYYRGGNATGAGQATAALTVPRSNPFFVHPTNPAAASVVVNYSFANDFNGNAFGQEVAFQNAIGFDQKLWSDWSAEGYVAHSFSRAGRYVDGQLRTSEIAAVLADSNPATAFNPFGDKVAQNPATIAKIKGFALKQAHYKLLDYGLKASGGLIDLPGGRARLAVGVEYYDASLSTTTIRNTGTPTTVTTQRSDVPREAKAVYAELFIPVVGADNARPGFQRVEVSVAGRYDHYSDFGGTTNPKVGLRWDPIEDLSLQASYGKSFRAPTLSDIDEAGSAIYNVGNIADPKSTAANGLTRGITLLGGGPGLKPEIATTWSLGAKWQPHAIRGLVISATYYNLDDTNRIDRLPTETATANETLLQQYIIRNPTRDQVLFYMNSRFASFAPEDPANIKIIYDGRIHNLGGLQQSGIDASVHYTFDTPVGEWTMGGDLTTILKAKVSLVPGTPFVDVLDTLNNPISRRARFSVDWRRDGWRATGFFNYVGEYDNNIVTPVQKVSSWKTFDATLSYAFPKDARWSVARGVRLTLSGQNLADTDPPDVINGLSAWDSQNASPIGRFVSFQVTKAW